MAGPGADLDPPQPFCPQIKAGLGMNFLCLLTLFAIFPTLGTWLYGLGEFPPEAAHIGAQSR